MFGNGVRGDFHHSEVAVFVGKNPWQSHGFPQARRVLKAIANDPSRSMIVIDPRRTETADLADLGALTSASIDLVVANHSLLDVDDLELALTDGEAPACGAQKNPGRFLVPGLIWKNWKQRLQRPAFAVFPMEEVVDFFIIGDFEIGAVPLQSLAGAQCDVAQ